MHVVLEVVSALLAILPIVAIATAYRQTPSPRLALALLAFAALEVRLVTMVLVHTVIPVDHGLEEALDFGGDLAVVIAFALAFLYGTRWWVGRAGPDVA